MSRSYFRLILGMFGLVLALSFNLGRFGVAHAEPGPRPTLTPVPPVSEPAPPAAAPAAVQQEDEAPAPTAKPRKAIVVMVTPIAPVQPVTAAPEAAVQPVQPVEGVNFNVRYVVPGNEAAPAATGVAHVAGSGSLLSSLLNNRALIVSLIALDIMAMCVVLRRRFAR